MSNSASNGARTGVSEQPAEAPRLKVDIDEAGYGHRRVIEDIHFDVGGGEICTILGRNGAGKSSVLLTVAGFIGAATSRVSIGGELISGAPYSRSRAGLATVLKGRSLFPSLTVAENFKLAHVETQDALDLFPELGKRLQVRAGLLSGGEQQMLTVSRGLLRRPVVLLIDELTLGISPVVTDRLLEVLVRKVVELDIATVVVEQHIHLAQTIATKALVMGEGKLRLRVSGHELSTREDEIERVYLGRPEADLGVEEAGSTEPTATEPNPEIQSGFEQSNHSSIH